MGSSFNSDSSRSEKPDAKESLNEKSRAGASVTDAGRQSANLSVRSDLLRRSHELNINLSETLEEALQAKIAEAAVGDWSAENSHAIKLYNDHVEENGCFGDEYREF